LAQLPPNATQAQIVNQMRKIRNKNPNCNHNSSSVFYQPHFNNVKYADRNGGGESDVSMQQRKEEILKKYFS
jgi:hypothetical protein